MRLLALVFLLFASPALAGSGTNSGAMDTAVDPQSADRSLQVESPSADMSTWLSNPRRIGGAASPAAYLLIGYGQSTMVGPFTDNSVATCAISSGVMTCTAGTANKGAIAVGSTVSCKGCPVGTTITSMNATGTANTGAYPYFLAGQGWTYTLSNNFTANGGVGQAVDIVPQQYQGEFASITASNINPNSYMINTGLGAYNSPRAVADTWTSSTVNADLLVNASLWSGLTPLHEASYGSPALLSALPVGLESPLSSLTAQFIQEAGFPSSSAIIAVDGARGSAAWANSCAAPGLVLANCLTPGSAWWANARVSSSYVKEQVQYGSNALANNPGSLPVKTLGVALRHGEVISSGYSNTTNSTSFTTGDAPGSTITLAASNPASIGHINPGDAVYDYTASCFVGYVHSYVGTALILSGNDPTGVSLGSPQCNSTATGNTIIFSEAHNYLAELNDIVVRVNTSLDVADNPSSNIPIVGLQPSTTFGTGGPAFSMSTYTTLEDEALADRRFILAGPSFPGQYQTDNLHQTSQGNALSGAYMGQWLAWWRKGVRTVPFIMTQAQFLSPTNCDHSHYCIRVTFQPPPTGSAAQQTLQFYCNGCTGSGSSDTNIPAVTNKGFQYTDGPNISRSGSLWTCSAAAQSTVTISSVQLATTTAFNPGTANQIDLLMSGDASGATNPTVCLGGKIAGGTWWGLGGATLLAHNVADSSCKTVANPNLAGKAFFNAACGSASANYLVNFAAHSTVTVGAAPLAPAW